MEDEGPVLARVLGTRRGRRLALAIEAELVALVAAAAAPHADDGTGPEAEEKPRGKVCVVFAGLGGYGRLLVHKTAERFEGLESFSIGGADNRRTVVLAAHAQPKDAAPFLRYADFVAKAPQRPAPATEATPSDTAAVVPVGDETRGEPPSMAGAQGRATTRPAREPRGVYVPPSRRDPATAAGGRGRGGLYVPPSRRHRDEAQEAHRDHSPTAADSGLEVLLEQEEQEHTTKRRRERGFGEEDTTNTAMTTTTTRPATKVDEELEEVLDRHDAELKALVDEAAFAEWAAAAAASVGPTAAGEGGRRGSPGRSSPDPWASLNRGRRDRRSESRRSAHEEEPDPEVVVNDYPAHVVELYDMEPSISDQELVNLLFGAADTTSGFAQTAGRLRRVNHTTALAAFASHLEAQEAMVRHTTAAGGQFKLRPLAEASSESKAIRGVALEVAKSVVPRPPTDARVARRMLVHALGLSPKRQNTTDN